LFACPSCGITWSTEVCPECAKPRSGEPDEVARARPVAVPVRTAIIMVVLNLAVLPGLGTLALGRPAGWLQGFFAVLGIILVIAGYTLAGVVLIALAWAGALFTSVHAMGMARKHA
jgi:hypothetical protein